MAAEESAHSLRDEVQEIWEANMLYPFEDRLADSQLDELVSEYLAWKTARQNRISVMD